MKTRWLKILMIATGLLAVPLTFNASEASVSVAEAACAGGTCCEEDGATCYPNNCSSMLCSEEGAYWKEEGSCTM